MGKDKSDLLPVHFMASGRKCLHTLSPCCTVGGCDLHLMFSILHASNTSQIPSENWLEALMDVMRDLDSTTTCSLLWEKGVLCDEGPTV